MNNQKLTSPMLEKYLSKYKANPSSRVFAPLAETYRVLGMQEKAIFLLKDGIKHHPTYALGYLGLASCYYDLRDFQLSYSTLRPLVVENRSNLKFQRLFGKVCYELSYFEEALETYKYLLFINPRDKDAARNVFELEEQLGDRTFLIPEGKPRSKNVSFLPSNDHNFADDMYMDWKPVDWREESSDSVRNNPITQENEKIQQELKINNEVGGPPMATHTLVDLYCRQNLFGKAEEILLNILEANPLDEKTQEKLKIVRAGRQPIPTKMDVNKTAKELDSKYGQFIKQLKLKAQSIKEDAAS